MQRGVSCLLVMIHFLSNSSCSNENKHRRKYRVHQVLFKIQGGRSVSDIPMHTPSALCSTTNRDRPTQMFNFIFEMFH